MRAKHEDRQYQQDIEDSVINYLFTKLGNPVVAAPGGVGKSFVMAKLTKRLVTEWPGTRVLILAQDAKLLEQNCNELVRHWPAAPAGIYSSGLKQRDTRHPIIFAGIQSVFKRGLDLGIRNVVFVDEADLVSSKEDAMYHKLFNDLYSLNPNMRIVGFTASPYRLGVGCLTNMDLWDEICIDLTKTDKFNWFIEHGFLAPLVNKKGATEIDITNISMRGGEFDEKEMQVAADTEELNRAVVKEAIRYGSDRKHWLTFSSGVKHGHNLAKIFNARGVPTMMLSGEDSMDHRQRVEKMWRKGEIRNVVNCGLYGRGFDFPAIDLIIWARATQSTALWLQGCVRGTRIAPGKQNCCVLDMAGNTRRLGPVNDPIIPAPRRKGDAEKGEAPVKECPECHSYIHTRIMVCPDCGYQFPPPQTVKKTADDADILRDSAKPAEDVREFNVLGVRYKGYLTKTNRYVLRATYSVGMTSFHEYLFFDESPSHFLRKRAESWWTHRGGKKPFPEGSDEAAKRTDELKIPSVIRVNVAPKYPEVLGCDFDEDAMAKTEEYLGHKPTAYTEKKIEFSIDDEDVPF